MYTKMDKTKTTCVVKNEVKQTGKAEWKTSMDIEKGYKKYSREDNALNINLCV